MVTTPNTNATKQKSKRNKWRRRRKLASLRQKVNKLLVKKNQEFQNFNEDKLSASKQQATISVLHTSILHLLMIVLCVALK